MKPVKVLVVDDSVLVHRYMKSIFQDMPDFELTACAENGKKALDICRKHRFDLAIKAFSVDLTTQIYCKSQIYL